MRYGTSEVVLDIKAENILKHVRVAQGPMGDDALHSRFEALAGIDGPVDIVVLDGSRVVADLASRLVAYLKGKGRSIDGIYSKGRGRIAGMDAKQFNGIGDGRRAILISMVRLDPVFAYSCTATALMRLNTALMQDAYDAFISNESSRIMDLVHEYMQGIDCISLEVLYGENGLLDLIVCDTPRSYESVSAKINELAYTTSTCRSIIASPGHVYRLSDALTALWNCSSVLKQGGMMIMLAECTEGIGARALQMLVEGRLGYDYCDDHNSSNHNYIDGLEYLYILKAIRERGYDVGLLTMLPEYYLKVLGFTPFRRVKDALAYILGKMGQRHKVTIVSDAGIIPLRMVEE